MEGHFIEVTKLKFTNFYIETVADLGFDQGGPNSVFQFG